jgi:hypothetical protein
VSVPMSDVMFPVYYGFTALANKYGATPRNY